MPSSYDFIIVGAGTAGCTLARRLVDTQKVTVALIEAGKKDTNPFIHMPIGVAVLSSMTGINWNYNTAAQSTLNDRCLFWPRGKVMGGSSSVNAMVYIRGQYSDYDEWEAMGAEGWSAKEVLPLFIRSEDNIRGADAFHGVGGPIGVSDLRYHDAASDAFVAAAQHVHLPQVDDFNTHARLGLGIYQVFHRDGQRCSTAKGFITPILQHPNLTIMTNTQVRKVLLEDNIATGVECEVNGQIVTYTANQEVILSGGAINSPQLLMLSGIGDKAHLAQHLIECIVDLPAVGQQLKDHLDIVVQVKASLPCGYAVMPRLLPKYIAHGVQYLTQKKGLLTSNAAEAGGFAASRYGSAEKPDLQFHFIPGLIVDHGRQLEFDYGFSLHVCHLYPASSGTIRLASKSPSDAPLIDPNYLASDEDLYALVDGVRLARQIFTAPEFTPYGLSPWFPAASSLAEDLTDEAIIAFIKAHAQTVYHPVGTCRMGAIEDPNTVVDPQCRVKGVQRLRVVDASVMPNIIGGNTNAPTIMIAEKIAAHIMCE